MAEIKNWNLPKIEDVNVEFTWGGQHGDTYVDYAPDVYFGVPGKPARQWDKRALKVFNPTRYLARRAKQGSLTDAFMATCDRLDAEFKKALKARVYAWPRRTKRRNKKTVYTPRDIYDLGNLYGSQKYRRVN